MHSLREDYYIVEPARSIGSSTDFGQVYRDNPICQVMLEEEV